MARSAPRPSRAAHRKQRSSARAQPAPDVLDPSVDATIQKMIVRFLIRTAFLFLIVSVLATYLPLVFHLPVGVAQYALFVAAFGVMIPFWKGISRIFDEVLRMGKEKVAKRRFADARVALEYFHRVGNMGFDMEGEGHYYLILAYLGLGEIAQAEAMTSWLKKHRKRYPWAEKAEALMKRRVPLPADPTGSSATEPPSE